jgi:glycosyltransferase involved in cell wall biosynthesis
VQASARTAKTPSSPAVPELKVAIDVQQTVGTPTGIGAYCRGLLDALPHAGVRAVALRAEGYDPWRFDRRVVWDQVLLPAAAAMSGARLLHCTSGSVPLVAPLPVVATIHDVAWMRGVQGHAPAYARWYFGDFTARRWRRVRRLIADSAFTRDELLACADLDPTRVAVVHPGVDAAFARVVRAPAEQATLLCVGTVEPRKNAAIVIEALAALPGVHLVCAGPPTPYQAACAASARRLGVADRVSFAGYVSRERLLELYATSTLAVVPSRYEGFGYAAAQALCAGLPLLCARSSSLIEIVGVDAPLVDPDDARAWADAIAAMLGARADAERRAAARRAGASARFSWVQAARATADVYRSALETG